MVIVGYFVVGYGDGEFCGCYGGVWGYGCGVWVVVVGGDLGLDFVDL